MSTKDKLIQKICFGNTNNIKFHELQKFLEILGFSLEHIKGDHYIFFHPNIEEIINIQPKKGMAKSYQVKQVRMIYEKYKDLFENK
ncbi:MAG: type II toxin-antitoxin system HicA family toxin [Lachnospiraceae bacterium]|nr:type II toxin-antitoxin system HicA family toxin [Lachnospiraceae bacterium]